jgi:iron complex transport system ATP-binding protein
MNDRFYFAYGLNMDPAGMQRRCPGAQCLGRARLPNHRFAINIEREATILPEVGAVTHGVLWRVSVRHEAVLDRFEDLAGGLYGKTQLLVYPDGQAAVQAMVYFARDPRPGQPREGNIRTITEAARVQRLPVDYQETLREWARGQVPGTAERMERAVGTQALTLTGVTVQLGGRMVLENVCWQVRSGSCAAVIGPNGSGKSTLAAIVSGYLWPQRGRVEVLGQLYGHADLQAVRRDIGLIEPSRMPEFRQGLSAREVVATGLFGTLLLPWAEPVTAEQWVRVDAELASLGIGELAGRGFRELSSGEQMKVLIGRALVSGPRLLILDEPTAGLDLASRAAVIAVLDRLHLRAQRPTMIVISHHLEELPTGVEEVLLLRSGRVFASGAAEEILTSQGLSELFDCPVKVGRTNGHYHAVVVGEAGGRSD